METHARYFLIGAFSLIVTLVLVFFVLWLGKLQLRQAYQDYDIRFHESVSGLAVGASVQFHGLQVGEVRKLSLDPNDPREISVIVRTLRSRRIPKLSLVIPGLPALLWSSYSMANRKPNFCVMLIRTRSRESRPCLQIWASCSAVAEAR